MLLHGLRGPIRRIVGTTLAVALGLACGRPDPVSSCLWELSPL